MISIITSWRVSVGRRRGGRGVPGVVTCHSLMLQVRERVSYCVRPVSRLPTKGGSLTHVAGSATGIVVGQPLFLKSFRYHPTWDG